MLGIGKRMKVRKNKFGKKLPNNDFIRRMFKLFFFWLVFIDLKKESLNHEFLSHL